MSEPSAVAVTWAAPIDDGGSAVTGYTVSWQQVDQAGVPVVGAPVHTATTTGTSAIADVFEQTQAVYAVTVTATNAAGTGMAGSAGASVSPLAQTASNVVVLTDATVSAATTTPTSMVWPAPAPTQVTGLSVGNAIVAGASAGAPSGILRKVTGISSTASAVTVTTSEAAITDVLTNGSLAANTSPIAASVPGARTTNLGWQVRPLVPGVTMDERASASLNYTKTLNVNQKLRSGMSISAKITISGDLATSITVRTGWGGLPNGVDLNSSAKITATAQAQFTAATSWSAQIAELDGPPATIMVGVVPVVIQPRFQVNLSLDGRVTVTAATTAVLGGGLSWDSSNPTRIDVTNLSKAPTCGGSGGIDPG